MFFFRFCTVQLFDDKLENRQKSVRIATSSVAVATKKEFAFLYESHFLPQCGLTNDVAVLNKVT